MYVLVYVVMAVFVPAFFVDRISHLERDLKNKRQLLADQKKKISSHEKTSLSDKQKMVGDQMQCLPSKNHTCCSSSFLSLFFYLSLSFCLFLSLSFTLSLFLFVFLSLSLYVCVQVCLVQQVAELQDTLERTRQRVSET